MDEGNFNEKKALIMKESLKIMKCMGMEVIIELIEESTQENGNSVKRMVKGNISELMDGFSIILI